MITVLFLVSLGCLGSSIYFISAGLTTDDDAWVRNVIVGVGTMFLLPAYVCFNVALDMTGVNF